MSIDLDLFTVAIIALCFLLAGTIKGIVGIGMAVIPAGVLTLVFDLASAMVLLIVPSVLTNVWQAAVGGHAWALIKRLWPFFLAAVAPISIGVFFVSIADLSALSGLLGMVLILYGAVNLLGYRLYIPEHRRSRDALIYGFANGTFTGMTGCFSVPGVMYLEALGLSRNAMIQAMGILFLVSSLGLGVATWGFLPVTNEMALASAAALIPVGIGIYIGQRLRHRLPEHHFKTLFFVSLVLLGMYLVTSFVAEPAANLL